jgi:hypothetical protein
LFMLLCRVRTVRGSNRLSLSKASVGYRSLQHTTGVMENAVVGGGVW